MDLKELILHLFVITKDLLYVLYKLMQEEYLVVILPFLGTVQANLRLTLLMNHFYFLFNNKLSSKLLMEDQTQFILALLIILDLEVEMTLLFIKIQIQIQIVVPTWEIPTKKDYNLIVVLRKLKRCWQDLIISK